MASEQEPFNTNQEVSLTALEASSVESSSAVLVAYNTTTGQVIGNLPIADEAAVRNAVERARAAQPAWAGLSFSQRGAYLQRFRNIMLERSDTIARLISQEVGKPLIEGLMSEIMAAADIINYYVKNAEKMLADEPVPLHLLKHRSTNASSNCSLAAKNKL